MTAAVFKRQARIVAFIASVLLNLMVAPAFAACSTPAGNEGDINYVSSLHVMVYCNGTSWIGMGVSQPVSFGTLTTNDFCTATSGTAISCTTQFVNLASQVTGTLGTTNGGTGLAAYTTGDMLYASATNTLSKLSIGTTGWVLTASPAGPTWSASVAGSVGSFSAGTTGFTPATATTGAVTLAGTLAVGNGGTGTATALTKGSVVIAGTSGVYTQDNANFFYDATNHRLGLGTATPTQGLTVFGNVDVGGTNGYLTEITNAGTSGTTVNKLAKLNTSGAAIIAATADIDGMLGIVVGETAGGTTAVTTGSAQIATSGQASCTFDGQTVPGDYVSISATVAGDCLDGGTSRPLTNQTIGRVLTANSGVGTTATVALGLNGSGTGGVPTGTIMAFAGTCPAGWTEYTAARGRFLRGIDNGAGIDPSGTRAAGSQQADAMQGHVHSFTAPISVVSGLIYNVSPRQEGGATGSTTSVPVSDGTNGTPRTSSETRPSNVAVTFCQYQGGSPVTTTASGTTNYVARWTSATTIGTGTMYDSGSAVGLNTASPQNLLDVNGAASVGYNVAAPTNGLIVNGNAGIGTTAPLFKLEVVGLDTTADPGNGGTGTFAITTGTGINTDPKLEFGVHDTGSGTPGSYSWLQALNTSVGFRNLVLEPSGGSVGIGTTAPSALLHVMKTSSGSEVTGVALTNNASASGTGINLDLDPTGAGVGVRSVQIAGVTNGLNQTSLVFRTSNAASPAEAMRITAGGNVGIGTASPQYTFQVRTGTDENYMVRFGNTVGSGVETVSANDANNTVEPMAFVASKYIFNATGNVGIGGTSPSQKLEVDSGNIYINSGQYLVSGGNYNTGGLNSYANGTLCFSTSGQTVSSYFTFGACSSDRRLKKDIIYLTQGLNVVEKLKPANFRLRKDPTNKLKAGFIAQDVALAIPEAVSLNSDHLYGFDSTAVLSYTVKAVQQLKSLFDGDHDALTKLQADNDNLRGANDNEAAQIKALTARLDALENAGR